MISNKHDHTTRPRSQRKSLNKVESFHERVRVAQKQKDDGSDKIGGKTKIKYRHTTTQSKLASSSTRLNVCIPGGLRLQVTR